jgi:hypothetical protein
MDNSHLLDEYVWRQKFWAGIFWLGIFLIAASFVILAIQIILFLKEGAWPQWVLLDVMGPLFSPRFRRWLTSPDDWLGLHKIVMFVLNAPILVFMFLLGILFGNVGKPK